MTGKCKTCKHRVQHPHHAGIGICSKKSCPHVGKCVGRTLNCKHHEPHMKTSKMCTGKSCKGKK